MRRGELWDAFAKTGRIEDYLRYRGIDIYEAVSREAKRRHAPDDRRPDHQGK